MNNHNSTQPPFGVYHPKKYIQKRIDWCQKLPANWLGKQIAQILRKQVLSKATMPLDLVLHKTKLRYYLNDNVSERNFVFIPWRFDAEEINVMKQNLPVDGVFIDIGANVGIYSAIASTVLTSKGTIVAIEPNPPVFERLQFNLLASTENNKHKPRVVLLACGIDDQVGDFQLYLDSKNLGASSLKQKKLYNQKSVLIPCLPLLDVIQQQNITTIDVVKCDIEGCEDKALVPFLTKAPDQLLPKCFIFENNQSQWNSDLLEALTQRNYTLTHQTRMNFIYQMKSDIKD